MKNITCLVLAFLLNYNFMMAQSPTNKLNFQEKNTVINTFCKLLNENYVYPDKAINICEALMSNNQNGKYDSLVNPNSLAQELNKDIRSLYIDKHLLIDYNPELEKDINIFNASKTGKTKILNQDDSEDRKKNYFFKKLEILPSNIGYMEFTNFSKLSTSVSKTIHASMQFLSNTDALIIDLRNNRGGNGETAGEILSYFFEGKQKTGKTFNRMTNKWTDNFVENKKTITGGLLMKMPIYILTSDQTYLAAESFAYILQTIKNATVIGDRTRGGAHIARSFSIGNGFVCFIPYARSENIITKTDWEVKGVIPKLKVEDDKCLSIAKEVILEAKLKSAKNESERNQIQYLVNYYKSKNVKFAIDSAIIQKFVGKYEYFEVTVSNNQLYFMDTKNFKKAVDMIPISNTLFQIGYDYQVEFIISKNSGDCTGMKMFWDDGYEEIISKSNK
ncbi:MAG: S41 family peptidase [Bacteroidetes Order II. Incertae sedis bacterium]|nr:S41 family peptidase [Bacteroidetes Order II. bacterium]